MLYILDHFDNFQPARKVLILVQQNDEGSLTKDILSSTRVKYVNKLLIENLNINSISGKFDPLKVIVPQGRCIFPCMGRYS